MHFALRELQIIDNMEIHSTLGELLTIHSALMELQPIHYIVMHNALREITTIIITLKCTCPYGTTIMVTHILIALGVIPTMHCSENVYTIPYGNCNMSTQIHSAFKKLPAMQCIEMYDVLWELQKMHCIEIQNAPGITNNVFH